MRSKWAKKDVHILCNSLALENKSPTEKVVSYRKWAKHRLWEAERTLAIIWYYVDQVEQFIFFRARSWAMGKRYHKVDNVLLHLLFHIPRQCETTPTIACILPDRNRKLAKWSRGSRRSILVMVATVIGSSGSYVRMPGQRGQHPLSNFTGVVAQAVASSVHWKQGCYNEVWFLVKFWLHLSMRARFQPSWRHPRRYPKSFH